MRDNVSTGYGYPQPAVPQKWNEEERRYHAGLMELFDTLFARKLTNVMLATASVNTRTMADGAVTLRKLADGIGKDIDISENPVYVELGDKLADDELEILALESRMDTAEGAISGLKSRMSTAESNIGSLTSAQALLRTDLDALTNGLLDRVWPVGSVMWTTGSAPAVGGTWNQLTVAETGAAAWERTA